MSVHSLGRGVASSGALGWLVTKQLCDPFCVQVSAAAGSVTRPRASTAAPAWLSELTTTSASVPWDLKGDTARMVRKKQVDGDFYLLVN